MTHPSKIPVLRIKKEFKDLISPLQHHEYLQLEANILADGCRDPIVTWNGYIIDGHNRYNICTQHQIPFQIRKMRFDSVEAVIAWICANQLGRRNITEETRKYLIGIQYENEKCIAGRRSIRGHNQHTKNNESDLPESRRGRHSTAQRIAEENKICYGTVQKYALYARALEEIGKISPSLYSKILSGKCKISHENVLALSKMKSEDILMFAKKLETAQGPYTHYQQAREELIDAVKQQPPLPPARPSVKDMPAYDPDAEITGLTLTIPSWISSIGRIRAKADLTAISGKARHRLEDALTELQSEAGEMLAALLEE